MKGRAKAVVANHERDHARSQTTIHPIVVAHGMVAEQEPGSPKRLQRLENLFRACTANLPLIGGLVESTLDSSRQIHVERDLSIFAKRLLTPSRSTLRDQTPSAQR